MSSARFVLFSSSASQISRQIEGVITKMVPGIKIIRLDTKEQRDRAKYEGRLFSIDSVPTLIIFLPNGQIQKKVGAGEIQSVFQPQAQNGGSSRPSPPRGSNRRSNNMYDSEDGYRRKYPSSDEDSEEEYPFDDRGDRGDRGGDERSHRGDRGGDRGEREERDYRGGERERDHRPRSEKVVHEESSDDDFDPPPRTSSKKKKVRISPSTKKSSSRQKEGRAEAAKKLNSAKKASEGEEKGMTASQKRGRAEAAKKLAALNKKKRGGPSRMKSIMQAAKEQEEALKRHLD